MTGLVPFAELNGHTLVQKVCNEGYRPELTPDIPSAYQNLIERCWSQNPEERLSFSEIVKELENQENGFILDTIEEIDFEDYCDFLNEYESTFNLDNSLHFDNFLQMKNSKTKSNQNNRRPTVYIAPQLDHPEPPSNKSNTQKPMKDDEDKRKIDSSQKLDSNKTQLSTSNAKHSKSRWSIHKNKSASIKSKPQNNIPKYETSSISNLYSIPNEIKIGMFSGGGCGKTNITLRYLKGEFSEGFIPTIEDSFSKVIEIDGKLISITIVDTAGYDDFAEMRFSYYSQCQCFILVFSIDNPSSIDDVRELYRDISDAVDDFSVVIAANNAELRDELDASELVPFEEYKKLEKEFNAPVIEVSPRYNLRIDQLFETVIRLYINKNDNNVYKKEKKKEQKEEKKSFWSKHFGKKK